MGRIEAGFVAVGVSLLGCSLARPAHADDPAVAQALFDRAKKAMAAHDYAGACPKFEESYKLQEALGTLLNLAACYEAEGRLASAWTTFLAVASKARAAGQKERATVAKERAAGLAPRLSNLAIDVASEAQVPGLEIRRDGNPVGPAEWGTALPADPGAHTVEASAPGKKPWSTTVTVSGGAATARVGIPKLAAIEAVATTPPVETRATASDAASASLLPDDQTSHGGNGLRIAGWIAGGVGLAGLAAGGAFGLLAMSAWNSSKSECASAVSCPTETRGAAVSDHDKALTFGNISTIAFISGGALVALGATLVLAAPRDRAGGTALSLSPRVGPGVADLALQGSF